MNAHIDTTQIETEQPDADALVLRAARAFERARPWPTIAAPRGLS